jgi:hypothetical protein
MFGLFTYLIMILLPVLIPVGVTVVHAVGEKRTVWAARTDRPARESAPAMPRPIPAVAPA